MSSLKKKVVSALIDHYVESVGSVLQTGKELSDSSSDEEEYGADRLGAKKEQMMAEAEVIVGTETNIESTLLALRNIDLSASYDSAQVGSLVITDGEQHYLLATATVPVEIDGYTVIGISTQSPVGNKLEGQKVGQRIELPNSAVVIKEIQ